jgi:hypothetical protein
MKAARNVLIILGIAAAVAFLPGGWPVAAFFGTLLSVILFAGLAWFAARLYMEHRVDLFGLGDRNRVLLYGAIAVIALTLTASERLFATGIGTLLWFVLIGGAVAALVVVWQAWRRFA